MSIPTHKPSSAVIVGLGRTGLSCARYLRERGWRLAVTDTRPEPPQLAALRELDPQIPVRLGGLDARLLDDALCVVVSPGVSLQEPFFVEARRRGLEIVGDIELFARAVDAPVAGITGTNGKSTVTTLLGRMAARAGVTVRVGGNLGEPALDLLGAAHRVRRGRRALRARALELPTRGDPFARSRGGGRSQRQSGSSGPLCLRGGLCGCEGAHLRALRHRRDQPGRSAGGGHAEAGSAAR